MQVILDHERTGYLGVRLGHLLHEYVAREQTALER